MHQPTGSLPSGSRCLARSALIALEELGAIMVAVNGSYSPFEEGSYLWDFAFFVTFQFGIGCMFFPRHYALTCFEIMALGRS